MTMKKKEHVTRRAPKKLTLNKETLRDLDLKRAAAKIKGGKPVPTNQPGMFNCP